MIKVGRKYKLYCDNNNVIVKCIAETTDDYFLVEAIRIPKYINGIFWSGCSNTKFNCKTKEKIQFLETKLYRWVTREELEEIKQSLTMETE